jgi:hypothetical protein
MLVWWVDFLASSRKRAFAAQSNRMHLPAPADANSGSFSLSPEFFFTMRLD